MGLNWSASGFDRCFDEQSAHTVTPRHRGSGDSQGTNREELCCMRASLLVRWAHRIERKWEWVMGRDSGTCKRKVTPSSTVLLGPGISQELHPGPFYPLSMFESLCMWASNIKWVGFPKTTFTTNATFTQTLGSLKWKTNVSANHLTPTGETQTSAQTPKGSSLHPSPCTILPTTQVFTALPLVGLSKKASVRLLHSQQLKLSLKDLFLSSSNTRPFFLAFSLFACSSPLTLHLPQYPSIFKVMTLA